MSQMPIPNLTGGAAYGGWSGNSSVNTFGGGLTGADIARIAATVNDPPANGGLAVGEYGYSGPTRSPSAASYMPLILVGLGVLALVWFARK